MTRKSPDAKNALVAVRTSLEAMAPQFAAALPRHVTPEKFTRVSMMAIQHNDSLLTANRSSLYQACLKCATDGLLPDGREAALVPFGKEVQYMPMTGGLLKMMRNSGDLKEISAHCVRENDDFRYELGDSEHIMHVPLLSGDRGKVIFTYCVAKTKDGGIYREIMNEEQIASVKAVSRTGKKNTGPWKDWPEEMRKKSVIRRIAKRMPMSTDIAEMVFSGDDSEFDNDREPLAARSSGPSRLKDALGVRDVEDGVIDDVEAEVASQEPVDADLAEPERTL